MKKPMSTAKFFQRICDQLVEKKQMPEILDYTLTNDSDGRITNPEFVLRENLDYEGSEGICLDLEMELVQEGERVRIPLGTFKTLRSDPEAMEIMGTLLADFLVEAYASVRKDPDHFAWEGYQVCAFDEAGKRQNRSFFCKNPEAAEARKEVLLLTWPKVTIRENATRKERTFYIKESESREERDNTHAGD